MSIIVVGADKLIAQFAAKGLAAEVAVQAGKDALGMEVLHIAQTDVPVLTGHLHDSITYESNPEVSRVYTEVAYAKEVEYGGPHNPVPEPYMRPAADTADTESVLGVMKAVLDSA